MVTETDKDVLKLQSLVEQIAIEAALFKEDADKMLKTKKHAPGVRARTALGRIGKLAKEFRVASSEFTKPTPVSE